MLRKSIPRKPGQGSSVLSRQKTATNHTPSRILFPRNVNKFLGSSISRGIATLLKVLNTLADTKSAGGVALRVRTQA